MEILSNNFRMPSNVRQLNQTNSFAQSKSVVNYKYSSPTFKGAKEQLAKELGGSVLNKLNLKPSDLKEIMKNPDKLKCFLDLVGGLVISIAATLVNLVDNEKNEEEFADTFVKTNDSGDVTEKIKPNTNAEVVAKSELEIKTAVDPEAEVDQKGKTSKKTKVKKEKFDRIRHRHPFTEETKYSKYIENNFKDDIELWNSNVSLFNAFAGKNNAGSHLYEGKVCSNRSLLPLILAEIQATQGDKDKILEIVDKYQALEVCENKEEQKVKVQEIENVQVVEENIKKEEVVSELVIAEVQTIEEIATEEKSKGKKLNYGIKLKNDILRVLNGKDKLTKAYEDIVNTSANKEEAQKRLETVNELIYPWSNKINKKLDADVVTSALRAINQRYSDCLEELAKIYVENYAENDCSAEMFYRDLANKKYSADAIKSYDISIKKLRLSFAQYNELMKANVTSDNIVKLAEMLHKHPIELNDIKCDNDLLELKLPCGKSLNFYFSAIKQAFELVHNEEISLEAKENIKFSKDKIVDELIKDYKDNNRTTYPNLVKFLYGPKHIIYNEDDFNKNQFNDCFSQLVNILNDDKLFDPNLFGDHAKMRFLERFVIGKCDWKNIEENAYRPMRHFVDLLKRSLYQNTSVRKYVAKYDLSANPIVGAQVIVKDSNDKEIKFTLDKDAKIHTIF